MAFSGGRLLGQKRPRPARSPFKLTETRFRSTEGQFRSSLAEGPFRSSERPFSPAENSFTLIKGSPKRVLSSWQLPSRTDRQGPLRPREGLRELVRNVQGPAVAMQGSHGKLKTKFQDFSRIFKDRNHQTFRTLSGISGTILNANWPIRPFPPLTASRFYPL